MASFSLLSLHFLFFLSQCYSSPQSESTLQPSYSSGTFIAESKPSYDLNSSGDPNTASPIYFPLGTLCV